MTRPGVIALGLLVTALGVPAGAPLAAPSSYSAQQQGTKVLYLLLEDLGYETSRIFDAKEIDPGVHLVVSIGQADPVEHRRLVDWTRGGKTLLVAPPIVREDGFCTPIALGDLTVKRKHVVVSESLDGDASKTFVKSGTHPDLKMRPSACNVELPDKATLLAGAKEAALAFDLPLGKGHLLFLAHEDMLVNLNLGEDDISVLVRRWLSDHVPAKGRVAFFEGRQGGQLLEMLRRAHLLPLFFHALFLLLLLYWCLAPRFGDSMAVLTSNRREFAQHARALGHLYQHRGASAHPLRRQFERFLSRMVGRGERRTRLAGAVKGQPAGAAEKTSRAAMAALISTRTGQEAASIESVLAQVEYTISSPELVDPKDAQRHFRLSQSLAALQHGGALSPGARRGRTKSR